MANDNHTPIPHLIGQSDDQNHTSDDQIIAQNQTASNVLVDDKKAQIQTPPPSITQGGKESEPLGRKSEEIKSSENTKDNESSEDDIEAAEKSGVKVVRQTPKIPKEVKKEGVSVAPSAKPFPTIYDVKVPIYSDDQIEKNLHQSFWTGARWLAELCKYLLWQSHIKLKKIGSKVIRQPS
ncbi:MAG: hypothetical protein U0525_01740 [Patescibacteria group bacterium]